MEAELTAIMPRRVCVMIVGPHRSGTSLLARVLASLGCHEPRHLVGGFYGNEDGHWESSLICGLNDELLEALGSRWDACFPLNENWQDSLLLPRLRVRAGELIDEEFGDAPLFVLKDPRICRVPQFWTSILRNKGIEVALVLPYRHPQQVSRSLDSRDSTPPWYGQLLWLRNILDAESGTRGERRLYTDYAELCSDWRKTTTAIAEAFNFDFPRLSPITSSGIDLILRTPMEAAAPDQLLPRFPAADNLMSWLATATEIFSKWSEYGESSDDYARLDELRNRFDNLVIKLGGFLNPAENAGLVGEGARRREELQQQLAVTENEVTILEGELESTRAELEALSKSAALMPASADVEHQLAAARSELASSEANLVALQGQLDTTLIDLQSLSEQNATLAEQVHALHRYNTDQEQRLAESDVKANLEAERRSEAEQAALEAQSELALRSAELEQVAAHSRGLDAKIAFTESRLRQRDEEVDQYRSEIEALKVERDTADELRKKLTESEAWVFKLAAERADLEKRVKHLLNDLLLHERKVESLSAAKIRDGIAAKDDELRRERDRAETAEAGIRERDAAIQDHIKKIATLTEDLLAKDRAIAQQGADLAHARSRTEVAEAARDEMDAKLRIRFEEIAKLTGDMLVLDQKSADIDWMRELYLTLSRRPFWWSLMPQGWRRTREHSMLRRAGLFDTSAYLERYPDVAREGMDPVRHYVLHGSAEGRDRSFG